MTTERYGRVGEDSLLLCTGKKIMQNSEGVNQNPPVGFPPVRSTVDVMGGLLLAGVADGLSPMPESRQEVDRQHRTSGTLGACPAMTATQLRLHEVGALAPARRAPARCRPAGQDTVAKRYPFAHLNRARSS